MPTPLQSLLLLGAMAHHHAAAERVEAVVFLHDDDVHSFQDVSSELEGLGLLPADALVITQEVNDNGFGLVSKGSVAEAKATLAVFTEAGLNASVVRCATTDAEIQRLLPKPSKASPTRDTFPQCSRWALTGACTRQPLFMHSRCVVSCLVLGPRYQEAAHARERRDLQRLVPQLLLVLAAAFALSTLAMRYGGGPEAAATPVEAPGLATRVATVLLMVHFFAEGLRNVWMAAQGEGGFQLDDAAVVITNDAATAATTEAAKEQAGGLSLAFATGRASWWKVPSTLPEDSAPSASLGQLKAQAAPAHARAPPGQPRGMAWPSTRDPRL